MFNVLHFLYFQNRRISRNYRYSVCGERASGIYVSPHGPRLSVIAAVSFDGVLAARISEEYFNPDLFIDFLQTNVVPTLQQYNGINANSVVMMGKASMTKPHELTKEGQVNLMYFCL